MTGQATMDLSQCDREPVHIPGAVQPHGLFFVLDPGDLTIRCASVNTEPLLGIEAGALIGRRIASIATLHDGFDLEAALRRDDLEQYNPFAVRLHGGLRFEAIAHRHDDRLIFECEPELTDDQAYNASHFANRVRAGLVRIRSTKDLDSLCVETARAIRELTGFDRVLVYKFRSDLTGEVVAEAAGDERYLGLRFPASDIPSQARALYAACKLRSIPTSSYVPARLVGVGDARPIDMTHAVLRSVSPVHLQYMRNMGVTASMGISLMCEDRLWGLVTCNHESGERLIPYRARTSYALIGEVVSSLIGQKEPIASAQRRVELLNTHAKLIQFVTQERDVVRGLTNHSPSLIDVTKSPGAGLYFKGEVTVTGVTPPPDEIRALVTWIEAQGQELLVFDSLPGHYAPAHAWKDVGCGLAASRITLDAKIEGVGHTWLLWFRPEIIQTVTWGGDPNKPSAEPLRPRSSFESWKEDVHLLSPAFSPAEIDAAREFSVALSGAILEIEARRQIVHAAMLLEQTNRQLIRQIEETQRAELELRRAQKLEAVGRLASGIAHEINTPIQFVNDSISFLKDAFSDVITVLGAPGRASDAADIDVEFLVKNIPEAIERSLEGVHRVATLVRAMKEFAHPDTAIKELADLNRALGVTVEIAHCETRGLATVSLDLGDIGEVPCFLGDLNQVFLNLIVNAAHAIEDTLNTTRAVGTIAIRTWRENTDVFISVTDDGGGIPEAIREQIFLPFFTTKEVGRGSGQGLAIARSIIVDKHGGSLSFESELGRGTTFTIRLPAA